MNSIHRITFKAILIGLLLSFPALLWASQMTEKVKTIKKSAVISADATINIEHQHGNLNITSWNKDSIRIDYTITVVSKYDEKIEMLMERVHVDMQLESDYAELRTSLSEPTFVKEWNNLKSITGLNGESIRIDAKVFLPSKAELRVSNNFGNIYWENNHLGPANIDIKHGDLRASKFVKLRKLEMAFANVYIREVGSTKISSSFSQLDINKAIKLIVDSRSSEYDLDEIGELEMQSTRDRIEIRKIGSISIRGTLSKIEIDKLYKEMSAHLKYGKIRVDEIAFGFESIELRPVRTNVQLNFEENCYFKVAGSGEDLEFIYDQSKGKINSGFGKIEGHIGEEKSTSPLVNIFGDHSEITLYLN